jgi:hypothetical protein
MPLRHIPDFDCSKVFECSDRAILNAVKQTMTNTQRHDTTDIKLLDFRVQPEVMIKPIPRILLPQCVKEKMKLNTTLLATMQYKYVSQFYYLVLTVW